MKIPRFAEWSIASLSREAEHLVESLKISPLLAQILVNRSYTTAEEAQEFLGPSLSRWESILLPYSEEFVSFIQHARKEEIPVLIYGDYDVDGITGTCIFVQYLQSIGIPVFYFIPQREREGYGIHPDVLNQCFQKKIRLLLTVDCGTEEEDTIQQFRSEGIEVIVTDHHPSKSPVQSASLFINPQVHNYPFRYLSGSGVAYKLIQYCRKILGGNSEGSLALSTLGTIADQMPLVGENRAMVREGLQEWNQLVLPAFRCLKTLFLHGEGEWTEEDLARRVAPLINAAGRRDVPHYALEFFLSRDESAALHFLHILEEKNQERKILAREILVKAENILETNREGSVLFAYDPDWNVSVLGQVASQFLSRWGKPVVLLTRQNEFVLGSARAPFGIPLKSLFVQHFDGIFPEIGGHQEAFGFRILEKQWDRFHQLLLDFTLPDYQNSSVLRIDAEIQDISEDLFSLYREMRPFGNQNPPPVFLMRKMKVVNLERVGENRTHLRLVLQKMKKNYLAFYSYAGSLWREFLGRTLDVAFSLSREPATGKPILQVVDVHGV
ncbi:MAG: single-stranded-DNA-specific exonuclease RecJ [bacterium JZ-2024 1]